MPEARNSPRGLTASPEQAVGLLDVHRLLALEQHGQCYGGVDHNALRRLV